MDKKELNKLIEQVLNEKKLPIKLDIDTNDDDPYYQALKKASGNTRKWAANPATGTGQDRDTAAKTIFASDGKPKDLSIDDLEQALKGNSVRAKALAAQYIKRVTDPDQIKQINKMLDKLGIKNLDPASDATTKATGQGVQDIDLDSYSYPRPAFDLGTANWGKFLGSQNQLIKTVFSQNNLADRLSALSKISEDLLKPKEVAKMQPRELLQNVMTIDLFDMLINQLDQRGAGYMFEGFLALLCGGNVVGGENGAADFKTADGSLGSSKFYNKWSNIKQSTKNWKVGDSIHYVVGLTESISGDPAGAKTPSGDAPLRASGAVVYTEVKIYYVVATNMGQIGATKNNQIAFSNIEGNPRGFYPTKKDSQMDMSQALSEGNLKLGGFYAGTVKLAVNPSSKKTYREKLDEFTKQDKYKKKDQAKALTLMKNFFTSMYKADEETKKYIATEGKPEDLTVADSALEQYDNANGYLTALLELITPGKTVKTVGQKRKLKEESKSSLDQLIEAIVKEKLLK